MKGFKPAPNGLCGPTKRLSGVLSTAKPVARAHVFVYTFTQKDVIAPGSGLACVNESPP